MRFRISCGVIPVYIDENNKTYFLLVQGYGNFWGFPKGHKKKGESHKETAERELLEETGISCTEYLGNTIFTERYRIPRRKGEDIIKKVLYFVGTVSNTEVKRQTTELKAHGWFSLDGAKKKLLDNRIKILEKVQAIIDKEYID